MSRIQTDVSTVALTNDTDVELWAPSSTFLYICAVHGGIFFIASFWP